LTVNEHEPPNVSELRYQLLAKLPDYMVPSAFITLDSFPLTPNGKLDRQALLARKSERPELVANYIAPSNPIEKVLVDIWSQVLRLDQVGVHDKFFEVGGDSIRAMQVIAKANQIGLRLTLPQIFQHQTITDLALATTPLTGSVAEQEVITGDVPLTPIQQWFFEQGYAEPHHWNQARLFELRQELDAPLIEKAIQQLEFHHDALRLRFRQEDTGWRQFNAGLEQSVKLDLIDLAGTPEGEQSAAMAVIVAELQASLDLTKGPLVRAAFFDLGTGRPRRLLLIVHHLAVDGISWRILLEDLQTSCEQLQKGEAVKLPAKTTSFRRWAEQLAEHARSTALALERDYWLSFLSAERMLLPVDFSGGENTEASARTVSLSLDVKETRMLLEQVPRAYNTQVNDVLLASLGLALTGWVGQPSVWIDLEGHGREALFDGADLSRTVGWFTTMFPVKLDLRGTVGPGEVLKSVKEQLRGIPRRGIGYGMLRYLRGDEAVATLLRAPPQPEVIFNYLGQFDDTPTSPFGWLQESMGPAHSPLARRSHLLSINSLVVDGRLRLDWGYSEAVHRRNTIERLARNFMEALLSLINHCSSPSAGAYTPSDFPEAGLDQEELDKLIAGLSKPLKTTSIENI
jgi:non-ribosomal peptide synthase protein (TIGR01720 family)